MQGISVTSDTTTGDVHLVSGSSATTLDFKKFSGASWSAPFTLSSADNNCPTLSYDDNAASFAAYWIESGLVKRRAYSAGSWDATTAVTAGSTTSCIVSDEQKAGGVVKVLLNDTTTAPSKVTIEADSF